MSLLRWVLNLLIGGWGLYNLMPILSTVAHKTGNLKPVPAEAQRFIPLMDATQWWHLGVWGALVLLLLAASWRIFSGGKAALLLAIATVLNAGLWWVFQGLPVYKQVFTPAELQADYYILGGMAVATLVAWLTERGK